MPRIAAPPPTFATPHRHSSSSPPRAGDLPPLDERYRAILTLQQLQHELGATRNEERATCALRGYFEPRLEQRQTCEKFLHDLELKFPQHARSFAAFRALHDLRAPRVRTSQIRARGALSPVRARTGPVPVGPELLAPPTETPPAPPAQQASGLPPYSERDPDPQSTMLLERRLASELHELGSLSGFCVPGEAAAGRGERGRDENASRRFSDGSGAPAADENAARRGTPGAGERARNENAARRLSLPAPPREPRRRESRDRREARDTREPRRERRERREAGGQRRERGGEQRPQRPAEERQQRGPEQRQQEQSFRRPSNAELIQPRQSRRSSAAPAERGGSAARPAGERARTSSGGRGPQTTSARRPPPLPPRAATLPSVPAATPAPAAQPDTPSPHSSASASPVMPVTPPLPCPDEHDEHDEHAEREPPAYSTLDPQQVTQSPPTTSLNVRPRRSLRSPSAPNAPPRLPPIDTLNLTPQSRRDRATMGDLMSDIVPVAGLQGEDIHVPAAISPLGADMTIPSSERYGERYAGLAHRAHRDATGGGKLRSFVKRWSGGNGRRVMV